jgi:hypothetical protein
MKNVFLIFCTLLFLFSSMPMALAQDGDRTESDFVFIDPTGKKGFMFGINIGYYLPNDDPTNFYDGTPKADGFLDLGSYIQLQYIQQQFQNELGNSVSNFQLVEYPNEMRYTNTVAFGGNVRYHFNWANAIVLDANYIGLKTVDAFVLGYDDPNSGTSQQIYRNFDISGKEDRLQLSLGYQVSLAKPTDIAMHFEFGPMMTSIKIKENNFTVGSRTYSILRAQSVGNNNPVLNNSIPNITSFGAYVQPGINMEFDKFTIDLDWRSSFEKIQLSENLEAKYRFNHMPMVRFVYRVSVKGF